MIPDPTPADLARDPEADYKDGQWPNLLPTVQRDAYIRLYVAEKRRREEAERLLKVVRDEPAKFYVTTFQEIIKFLESAK